MSSPSPFSSRRGPAPDLGPAAGCVSGRNSYAVCRDCSPLNSRRHEPEMAPLEGDASDPFLETVTRYSDPTVWCGCSSINTRSQGTRSNQLTTRPHGSRGEPTDGWRTPGTRPYALWGTQASGGSQPSLLSWGAGEGGCASTVTGVQFSRPLFLYLLCSCCFKNPLNLLLFCSSSQ